MSAVSGLYRTRDMEYCLPSALEHFHRESQRLRQRQPRRRERAVARCHRRAPILNSPQLRQPSYLQPRTLHRQLLCGGICSRGISRDGRRLAPNRRRMRSHNQALRAQNGGNMSHPPCRTCTHAGYTNAPSRHPLSRRRLLACRLRTRCIQATRTNRR